MINSSLNYFIGSLLTAITTSSLAVFVFSRDPKSKLYRSFFFYTFSIAAWSFPFAFMANAPTKQIAIILGHVFNFGVSFICVCFVHFVLIVMDAEEEKIQRIVRPHYIIAIIFTLLIPTKLMVTDVVPKFGLNYFINPGIAYYPYVLWWMGCIIYGLSMLFIGYRNSRGARRNQLKYLFFGSFIGYVGGPANFLLVFDIKYPFYPFGAYGVPIYTVITAYAIVRYHLLDINIALTRAGIFAFVYLFVLGIPLWLGAKTGLWAYSTVIMAALATSGPFIYLFLQRRAEEIIRKEQLEYQRKLREASSTMMLSKDLDSLLKVIVLNAVDIVRVKWAGIYLKDDKQPKYLLKHSHSLAAGIDLPREFADDADFVTHLYKSRLPLIGEEVHSQGLKFGLSVPCFIDSNMIGFLLLGDKPSDKMYDQSDVNEFALLSNQAALAIENCQFYSQERQRQQFLRVSSLDKQMACLAHEIDNPNSALLSSLGSMELALDDLTDAIPQDKMDYIKKKLERARFNSKRISKMITSVREFSRVSSGELKPIKLEWIMEGFLNITEPQFKYNGVNFTQEVTNEAVWLRANKVEIEQVLVNLATNSVQAINEIWQRGRNTPESKKEIIFRAYKIDSGMLRIYFSDTGSGMEKDMLEQCFLDFVTTKGSAEGTGLGLSISRKIIHKHGGKIWAESEGENKGAAFHIELPVANDLSEEEKRRAEFEHGNQGKKDMFIQDFPN